MEMNLLQLLELLQSCDESPQIEAKESKSALGESVTETISSFSNEPDLGGGYIVLGLRKNKDNSSSSRYSIVGVDDPDKIQGELVGVCRNVFNIQIRPQVNVESIEGKVLVVVFIPETFCRDKPVFIKKYGEEKGTFRRIGSSDIKCTAEDLDLLYQLRRQMPYESDVFPDAAWEDVDPLALTEYRRLRAQIDPKASELLLDDKELLIALGHAIRRKKEVIPTVGGILLFATKAALRRTMPIPARIDYIFVEGRKWVQNAKERYSCIEYREALIIAMSRLHAQIMSDLPTRFHLKTGDLQRSDIPSIPRDVIREALANALMHRDYRAGQATQIIRYANRIEFNNPGYSLKPFDELGQSGSLTRNIKIASVFHDLKFAETKGTGIRTMRDLMREANLTVPLIESDQGSNQFSLTVLMHNLFDKQDIEWLKSFKDCNLIDEEARTLIVIREMGAITNADYRIINSVDTLTASSHLRRLRDIGLLEQKGGGNATYYVPTEKLLLGDIGVSTPHVRPLNGELAPHVRPLNGELFPLPEGLPAISEELRIKIDSLKKRNSTQEVKKLIKELCMLRPLKLSEISAILDRNPKYVREIYLNNMLKAQEIEHVFIDTNHPQQAYRVKCFLSEDVPPI
ncbi:MAG: putative DNA binding domain-containing protein [Chlamydiae bacterium]|nr:putative DNA binding domain-containing protein [Chlamydiota bacterium]